MSISSGVVIRHALCADLALHFSSISLPAIGRPHGDRNTTKDIWSSPYEPICNMAALGGRNISILPALRVARKWMAESFRFRRCDGHCVRVSRAIPVSTDV